MEVCDQLQVLAALSPGTHWIRGCIDTSASLDVAADISYFVPLPPRPGIDLCYGFTVLEENIKDT